jgi:hypothetical protein
VKNEIITEVDDYWQKKPRRELPESIKLDSDAYDGVYEEYIVDVVSIILDNL